MFVCGVRLILTYIKGSQCEFDHRAHEGPQGVGIEDDGHLLASGEPAVVRELHLQMVKGPCHLYLPKTVGGCRGPSTS